MNRKNFPIVVYALAVASILGCSASLADTKKPKPKPDTPRETLELNYGTTVWTYTQQKRGNGPLTGKPLTTVNPALQGNVLQKNTAGGGAGPIVSPKPIQGSTNR